MAVCVNLGVRLRGVMGLLSRGLGLMFRQV